ncbi:MAG: OB-fold nucleic acid binding domain-containing protein, partial [Nanoarchaeota archaeon]
MDFEKLQKERSYMGSLSGKDDGKKAVVAGWVYDIRDLGKVRFVVLRDMSGEMQITSHKDKTDKKVFEAMNAVRESAVVVSGTIKKSDKAPGGRELVPSSFEVVGEAEQPLPIDISDFSKTELPKRLDYRFLDFHRKRTQA